MSNPLCNSWRRGRAPWLTLCALMFLNSGPLAAQEAKENTVPLTGFTRPGTPDDDQVGGKVVPAVDDPELRKTALGGTVYFRVVERGPDGWGDAQKFLELFQAGIDGSGASSPAFDPQAKYLYLYQIVNDRHAATALQSVSVQLQAEVKDITSWGYFPGVGFATLAKRPGQEQPVVQPVAFNHILGAANREILYQRRAPAVPLEQPLQLTRVPTVRGEGNPLAKQKQKPIAVVWDALDPATNPNHVMLLETSDFDKKPCFRAVWNAATALPRDGRSTIFGFTSNLPPTLEPVRLRGLRAPGKDNPIVPAADAEPERTRLASTPKADGRVPSPKPDAQASDNAAPSSGGTSYPPPGMPSPAAPSNPGGGGGGGFGGGGGGGGAGSPIFAGTGGGGGGSSPSPQPATPTPTSPQQNALVQTINFNPTLLNAQGQQQQQQQKQRQLQRQSSDPHASAVVPQPATVLLAAVGLPVLLLYCRKRRGRLPAPQQRVNAE